MEGKRWRTGVILSALLVLAVMVVIFLFSAQPAEDSSELSGSVLHFLARLLVPDYDQLTAAQWAVLREKWSFAIRKAAHFTEFAALGLSWRLLLDQLGRRRPILLALLWAWLLATVYAATDELHQLFVPGRGPAVTDVCIDSAGALCGALLMTLLLWLIRRRRQRWVY